MSAPRPIDVAVAGHICLDIIPRFSPSAGKSIAEILRPGTLVSVGPAAISTGGPVSNTGIGAAMLDLSVEFLTQVGDDAFGQMTISRLRERGHSEGVKICAGQNSAYTLAISIPGIDRLFIHYTGTNDTFTSDSVDAQLVSRAKLFHLGYPPIMRGLYANEGEELARTFQKAKAAGATTSLDMTFPDPNSEAGQLDWRKILQKTLPYVDIALPSIEEVFYMLHPKRFMEIKIGAGSGDVLELIKGDVYTELADTMLSYGAGMCALKSAHRGFYLKCAGRERIDTFGAAKPAHPENWANREIWCPSFLVEDFISATGSGDSSIAGFMGAYLRGESMERTLLFANCVGGQNLTALDALSGIKSWPETVAMVDANRTQNPLDPEAAGWQWDEKWRMWEKK
jgi:sugar/nucleoside kinase (ribokinase family)